MQTSAAAEHYSSVPFSELLGVYPRVAILCARAGNLPAAEQVDTRKYKVEVFHTERALSAYKRCCSVLASACVTVLANILKVKKQSVPLAHPCSVMSYLLRFDSAQQHTSSSATVVVCTAQYGTLQYCSDCGYTLLSDVDSLVLLAHTRTRCYCCCCCYCCSYWKL
jgi:hypothetical protein